MEGFVVVLVPAVLALPDWSMVTWPLAPVWLILVVLRSPANADVATMAAMMLTDASRNCFFINKYSVSEANRPQQARAASGPIPKHR
jgi:hypothetical protein